MFGRFAFFAFLILADLLPFKGLLAQNLFPRGSIQSPKEFLGYELGERFTPHHRLVDYAEHIAEHSDRVVLTYYGETYEHRPLIALFVSAPANIAQLETIRQDNLKRAGILPGTPETRVPITWFSYNVHGNEAVGVETAIMTLWSLVDSANTQSAAWLKETVVAIDPCLNPDGHTRYVNWYQQKANLRTQPDSQSTEHFEPWPGGRPNHYLFDLNRDWAWQVQQESQQRSILYQQWLPQIHIDFHEQGVDHPYFFAPAAEPVHPYVSVFQRTFQETAGKNIAQYFDRNAWLYFTREVFDLFYPGYGDTWPTFNGAIGMTYEQAGSGRAGLAIQTSVGDTLTLRDRMLHHYTAGMATIETVVRHREQLLEEFSNYFADAVANPPGKYRTYVLKAGDTPARLSAIKTLLDRNGIQYGNAQVRGRLNGYSYATGLPDTLSIAEADVVVSAHQAKAVLVQTLFDPNPSLTDSLTYDITSWAIPYAHGVNAFALEQRLDVLPLRSTEDNGRSASGRIGSERDVDSSSEHGTGVLAYVIPWHASVHVRFLAGLLDAGLRVRFASQDFHVGGTSFKAGSLIVGREGNEGILDFEELIHQLARKHAVEPIPVQTGYMDLGKDFGSAAVRVVVKPRVAIIAGPGVSSSSFGELWHYFEQDLDYPFSVIDLSRVGPADLSAYNVLILPSGNYHTLGESGCRRLNDWVVAGGKLIAIESALASLAGKSGFGITEFLTEIERKDAEKRKEEMAADQLLLAYGDRERAALSTRFSGAIYSVHTDSTHPLGYGLAGRFYTMKNRASRYAYLKNGINVGTIRSEADHRSGFAGHEARQSVAESLVFGVEGHGKGHIVYFVDNPIFRGFWEQGKLVLGNAVFLVGQ